MPKAGQAWHSAPIRVVDCVSIHEWIELFNGSGQPVDLGDCRLDDETDAQVAGPQGSARYVIPAGTLIGPGGSVCSMAGSAVWS